MAVYSATPREADAAPSAPEARAARGAGALLARAALLLGIAALPVGFSAWIDPARLVAPRSAEREIARVLATGTAVTDFENYDDRAIEKHLASFRQRRPDVLVIGSSRLQMLRGCGGAAVRGCGTTSDAAFVNASVHGAVLDDLVGLYGLYDTPDRRPRRVILGVDPWTEHYKDIGWRVLAAERAMVLRRAGAPVSSRRDLAAAWWRAIRRLGTAEYFRLSVYSFRRYGTGGIAWVPTTREQNAHKTKRADGSVVWPPLPPEHAERTARWFATSELPRDGRFHDFTRRPRGRRDALERFVRYLRSEGVSVTMVLVPFPTEVYDASRRMSGDSLASVERGLRAMAGRTGAQLVGSFDPRRAGVTTRDFFDEDHLRPEPLARLVEPYAP